METCNAEATWIAAPQPDAGAQASLLDRFGGLPRIEWLVDRFLDQIGSDHEIAPSWVRVNIASMRKRLTAFFAEALGARRADGYVESRDGLVQLDSEQFLRVALMLRDTISSIDIAEELHAEVELAIFSHALIGVP